MDQPARLRRVRLTTVCERCRFPIDGTRGYYDHGDGPLEVELADGLCKPCLELIRGAPRKGVDPSERWLLRTLGVLAALILVTQLWKPAQATRDAAAAVLANAIAFDGGRSTSGAP